MDYKVDGYTLTDCADLTDIKGHGLMYEHNKTGAKECTYPIVKDDFNIYSVEFASDSLVFYVNYEKSFVYPRIETELEGQFPFDLPYFLLIDMQLGGAWVGEVEPADLPVEMEVDWVRHYQQHAR